MKALERRGQGCSILTCPISARYSALGASSHCISNTTAPLQPASYSAPQGLGHIWEDGFHSEHVKLETNVCVQTLWAIIRTEGHPTPPLNSHLPPRIARQTQQARTSSRPQADSWCSSRGGRSVWGPDLVPALTHISTRASQHENYATKEPKQKLC